MPILQNIQNVEQKAETLRKNASNEVEIILEETKANALLEAKKLHEEALDAVEKSKQETAKQIKKLEIENSTKIAAGKAKLESLAEKKKMAGIDYIMKRVLEI